MKEELHLFIIWSNGRDKQQEILEDMKKNFEIVKVYEVEWNKEIFAKSLSRFYGTHLPKDCRKETYCGNGKFILVILKVKNPIYEKRMTTRGEEIVNIKMFDKKTQYRELTGGGDKVHGTNDEIETNHDLTLLLGKNIQDFLKNDEKWDGKIEYLKTELFGTEKWNNVSDMFYALNNCVKYAILRNYESLPNEIYEKDHNDIDIICESVEDVKYILNAEPVFEEEYRVHYKTKVEDRDVYFDLRHIGDNYYYEQIEKDILKDRIYNEKGFYTLSKENYFYTLLYHALIHKLDFKEDYKKKLKQMNIEDIELDMTMEEYANILKRWMLRNEYIMIKPKDESVIFNLCMAEYFKPIVYNTAEIDILMATYNGEKYLEEQIESILQQTYTNFRLIISDDCSTDDTRKILEEYEKKDRRIKVYYQEKNIGYIKNFEFLLNKVECELYALSDQDDIWLPNKIEMCIDIMKKEQKDLVFSDLNIIDENGQEITKSFWKKKGFYKKIKKDIKYKGLRLNNYITGCTIVSKKQFLSNILPIPQNTKYLIHDYWIAIVMSLKGEIKYLDMPLIKYRQHESNQVGTRTKSKELKNIDEIRNMFIEVKLELFKTYSKNRELFNEEEQEINNKALQYFKRLKEVKKINFKDWGLFYELYRYETFSYFIANFIILNIPILAKLIYIRR